MAGFQVAINGRFWVAAEVVAQQSPYTGRNVRPIAAFDLWFSLCFLPGVTAFSQSDHDDAVAIARWITQSRQVFTILYQRIPKAGKSSNSGRFLKSHLRQN